MAEILTQESLMRLISLSNEMKSDKQERDVLYMRSSLNDSLFYEIRKINTDVFIFLVRHVRKDVGEPDRMFCCYINGDIIYDGFWMYELEESLPLMYNRMVKVYHRNKIANNGYDGIQLEYINPIEIGELNNSFLRSGMFSFDTLKKYFNNIRFRY